METKENIKTFVNVYPYAFIVTVWLHSYFVTEPQSPDHLY